jgi:hypothetical protein
MFIPNVLFNLLQIIDPSPDQSNKRTRIMAMERFQRCRDLFANFKPSQSEMSLLDAPANGMSIAFVHS